MDDNSLADRLVSYSDAMAAVAFVGVSGLGIALGDPDVRCSLALASGPIAISNLVSAGVMTALMLKLRSWELELRETDPLSERAQSISRYLHLARIVVVWLSAFLSVIAILGATSDHRCEL